MCSESDGTAVIATIGEVCSGSDGTAVVATIGEVYSGSDKLTRFFFLRSVF